MGKIHTKNDSKVTVAMGLPLSYLNKITNGGLDYLIKVYNINIFN